MTSEKRTTWEREKDFWEREDFVSGRVLLGGKVIRTMDDVLLFASSDVYYGVTGKFIYEYNKKSKFEDHSFVSINTCCSACGNQGKIGSNIAQTMNALGAGASLGWNGTVHNSACIRAAKYIFDRMFAENAFEKQTPPSRPFGISDVIAGLQAKKYHIDNLPHKSPSGAELIWIPRSYKTQEQEDVIFRPSIYGLDSFDIVSEKELILDGNFGDLPGEVCIGANCISPTEWDKFELIVPIEPNEFGPVLVRINDIRSENTHESNVVPLSKWQGNIEAEGDLDPEIGPHANITMQFAFRSDIHPFRPGIDEQVNLSLSGDTPGFEKGMQCKYTYTGQGDRFQDDQYYYEYEGTGTENQDPSGEGKYYGTVILSPSDGKATFIATCLTKAIVTKTKKSDPTDIVTEEMDISIMGMFEADMTNTVGTGSDPYGTIQGGTGEFMIGSSTMEAKWEKAVPQSPVTPDTAS